MGTAVRVRAHTPRCEHTPAETHLGYTLGVSQPSRTPPCTALLGSRPSEGIPVLPRCLQNNSGILIAPAAEQARGAAERGGEMEMSHFRVAAVDLSPTITTLTVSVRRKSRSGFKVPRKCKKLNHFFVKSCVWVFQQISGSLSSPVSSPPSAANVLRTARKSRA